MPDRRAVQDLVARYVAALDARDVDALAATFTDDAVHDNPMGAGSDTGVAAIRAFYDQTFSVPAAASLDGPIAVHADTAAFRVVVEIPAGRTPFRLLLCYLAEISPDCRIAVLRAVPDSVALNT